MNGRVPHSRDTFMRMTDADKWGAIYDLFLWDAACTEERRTLCMERFTKDEEEVNALRKDIARELATIRKQNWISKALIAVVGAIAAFLGFLKT